MALQAAAKRTTYLRMEAISDYGMDVKPSLKYTPSKPALGVLRDCYREAFTLLSQVGFELRKFNANSVGYECKRIQQPVALVTSR